VQLLVSPPPQVFGVVACPLRRLVLIGANEGFSGAARAGNKELAFVT